jgi:hypothetical protein
MTAGCGLCTVGSVIAFTALFKKNITKLNEIDRFFYRAIFISKFLLLKISHCSKFPLHSRIAASTLWLPVSAQKHSGNGLATNGQSFLSPVRNNAKAAIFSCSVIGCPRAMKITGGKLPHCLFAC